MKCPTDDTTLELSERQGIEIDYCPACRGVWLDRGELDKLLERAGRGFEGADRSRRDRYDDEFGDRDDRGGHRRPRKRRSFLDDVFDFG